MGTIAEKLQHLDGTREKILTETNRLGVGLTEQDKFRDYAKGLHDGYVDLLNNGTDVLYDNMEKVTGNGSNITLENTEEAPMRSDLEGDTYQETTTGKNLCYFSNFTEGGVNFNGSEINVGNTTGSVVYVGSNFNLQDDTSKSGKTYTIYVCVNGTKQTGSIGTGLSINFAKTGVPIAFQVSLASSDGSFNNRIYVGTITLGENEVFRNVSVVTNNAITVNINAKVMIVEGSYTPQTIGDYEPYTNGASPNPDYPQPINVVSGKQEVDIYNNTNLFNIENNITNANIDSSGTITNGTYSLYYFEVNDTKKYRMTTGSSRQWVYSFYTEIPQINSTGYSRQVHSSLVEEFSIPQGYKYVAFRRIDDGGEVITNIQINEINAYEINLGKNLLNIDGTRTSEGLTNTTNGTIISVSGTSSNSYTSLTFNIAQSIPIGTYTFSIQEKYSKRIGFIAKFSDNSETTYYITANTLSTTFTTTKEIISYRLYMETTSGTTYNMTIKPQLEKGSTASSFSQYKTPIELCKINTYKDMIFRGVGSNLYSSSIELGTINTTTGADETVTNCVRSADYVEVKPNTTYTISNNKNYQNVMYFYGADKVLKRTQSGTAGIYTFTTYNDEFYIRNRTSQGSNQNDTSVLFQLVEGSYTSSTIPPYEPYNSKGKWLLHKEIGKVVLNGSENWVKGGTTNNNQFIIANPVNNVNISTLGQYNNNVVSSIFSNYFTPVGNMASNNGSIGISFCNFSPDTQIRLGYGISSNINTVELLKIWLSTHNTIVYYVLATPTTEEITDSELISQLNQWYNEKSRKGTTNISVTSEDLPAILNVIAIKKYE